MPNGRSGGFLLSKSKLRNRITREADTALVGSTVAPVGRSKIDVTAVEALRMVDAFAGSRIWIEEQDDSWFIVHLDHEVHIDAESDPSHWLVVQLESPLHASLKQLRHWWLRI